MPDDQFLNEPGRTPPSSVSPPKPPRRSMPSVPPSPVPPSSVTPPYPGAPPSVGVPRVSGTPGAPFAPPPEGWKPVDAGAVEKNWQGSASLALALIGAGFIGIVFGILGLKSVKAGRANNHGIALAGTIVGALSIVAIAILIPLRLTTNILAPSVPPDELAVGTCVQRTGMENDTTEAQDVITVKTASCAREHYGEVYYQGTLTDLAWSSESEISDEVFAQCQEQLTDFRLQGDFYYIQYFFPSADSWKMGDRGFTCILVSEGDPLVGHFSDAP